MSAALWYITFWAILLGIVALIVRAAANILTVTHVIGDEPPKAAH